MLGERAQERDKEEEEEEEDEGGVEVSGCRAARGTGNERGRRERKKSWGMT